MKGANESILTRSLQLNAPSLGGVTDEIIRLFLVISVHISFPHTISFGTVLIRVITLIVFGVALSVIQTIIVTLSLGYTVVERIGVIARTVKAWAEAVPIRPRIERSRINKDSRTHEHASSKVSPLRVSPSSSKLYYPHHDPYHHT